MEFKDYYQIMGVNRDATQDEIKRVYRKLARKYHPDVSKEADAEARFKEVGEAYEVLKDPEKRSAYDRLGANWKAGQDFRPPPGWDHGFEFRSGGFSGADASQFSDFFESLFGSGFAPRGGGSGFSMHGQDSYTKILIDLEDAFHGATRTLHLKHSEIGSDGRPRIEERTLNVQIPQGVFPGQHIRLPGQGESGMGKGKAGDLFIELEFRPHRLYQVEGRDLYLDLPLAPWEAALGASVKVPTPAGPVDLKIPPESAGGRKLRLKGRGIPGRPPGDFFVVLQIALPPADSEAVKSAYRELERSITFNPRERLGV